MVSPSRVKSPLIESLDIRLALRSVPTLKNIALSPFILQIVLRLLHQALLVQSKLCRLVSVSAEGRIMQAPGVHTAPWIVGTLVLAHASLRKDYGPYRVRVGSLFPLSLLFFIIILIMEPQLLPLVEQQLVLPVQLRCLLYALNQREPELVLRLAALMPGPHLINR